VRTLGDGYRVELRVVVWEGDDVLRVPGGALFRLGEKWATFAVEGGVARRRVVEVGHRSERDVEVLSGLAAGAQVVLHPSEKLEDGMAVGPASAAE
jgi:HlyD family secretion protein